MCIYTYIYIYVYMCIHEYTLMNNEYDNINDVRGIAPDELVGQVAGVAGGAAGEAPEAHLRRNYYR